MEFQSIDEIIEYAIRESLMLKVRKFFCESNDIINPIRLKEAIEKDALSLKSPSSYVLIDPFEHLEKLKAIRLKSEWEVVYFYEVMNDYFKERITYEPKF